MSETRDQLEAVGTESGHEAQKQDIRQREESGSTKDDEGRLKGKELESTEPFSL